ncbi:MAG: superoxide dismutase [Tissierellia bacterium]|nr:superoxide dismutase [Tissierellia bacterium]
MINKMKLPYAYDALEPHIDAQTVEIHYEKHHQTYADNLNKALESHPDHKDKSLEELVKGYKELPSELQTVVRNNGGGVYNHDIYWAIMSPDARKEPEGKLKEAIEKKWGSLDEFKAEFKKKALGQFGSGWAWLVKDGDGVDIVSTPNQDNPITDGKEPLLGIDVWEHAYYLKYQNKRADYVDSWWEVLDWAKVEERM